MSDYLADMIARRRSRIASEYGGVSREDLARAMRDARPPRDFAAALRAGEAIAVIGEVKKASPSVGSIAPDVDAAQQAQRYESGGVAAISVLTEPEDFGGSFRDLAAVTATVGVPVLCKDFVVDPVQLAIARANGADAVLLMVSVLGESTRDYIARAESYGLTPLVEVIDLAELYLAVGAGARVVGVNNRNLHTLAVDPAATREVFEEAARFDVTLVSASGVRGVEDVVEAARIGADAVLVGETLMRAEDPAGTVAGLAAVPRAGSVSA